jgi:exonuclease III
MITFLLWNIRKQPLQKTIAQIASINGVDLILLLESEIHPTSLLSELNPVGKALYEYSPTPLNVCEKVQIYSKIPSQYLIPFDEDERATSRLIKFSTMDILLVVFHGVSKTNFDEDSQSWEMANLARFISSAEKRAGHKRTILAGDLNMQPFENGVVSAGGLHAVMSRDIASKNSRTVQNREYTYFYNPMWGLYSNGDNCPPATFYYPSSNNKAYYWHMFDQVLIRPELLDYFKDDELRILDNDGVSSLLSRNRVPNKSDFSDHLPLIFKIDI